MSDEIDRVLRKLDVMDERSRDFEVETTGALARLEAGVAEAARTREAVASHETRIAALEQDKAERKGERKAQGRGPLVIAGAAGAGGVGIGSWLLQWVRELFGIA